MINEEEHICDIPPPGTYDMGDVWDCSICHKSYQARPLAEMAVERPYAYKKTYDFLKKKDRGDIVIWTTNKKEDN